jgi:hypothetical protein
MATENKEPWLNYLALTTVILAVCATLSSFRGSSYSTRAVLSQTQAANQWSYFQSKSIKGYIYEVQKEELDAQLRANAATWPPQTTAIYRDLVADFAQQIARYDGEKAQIQADARALEARRDHAQSHSRTFGMAVIFLQIAILMSSVSALLKKKVLWMVGSLCGCVGIVYFVLGLLPSVA